MLTYWTNCLATDHNNYHRHSDTGELTKGKARGRHGMIFCIYITNALRFAAHWMIDDFTFIAHAEKRYPEFITLGKM